MMLNAQQMMRNAQQMMFNALKMMLNALKKLLKQPDASAGCAERIWCLRSRAGLSELQKDWTPADQRRQLRRLGFPLK